MNFDKELIKFYKDKNVEINKLPFYKGLPNLPKAITVDLDGTVCINDGHRSFYEESKVLGDKPNQWVIDAVKMYAQAGHFVIFCSGRHQACEEQSKQWIEKYIGFEDYLLFMRKNGDSRQDAIIKKEIYERDIMPYFNIVAVFDDRSQVVRMLRNELGLNVFQVSDGIF